MQDRVSDRSNSFTLRCSHNSRTHTHISITLSHEISSPLTKALSHKDICQLSFPLPEALWSFLEDGVCGAVELYCILLKGVLAYFTDINRMGRNNWASPQAAASKKWPQSWLESSVEECNVFRKATAVAQSYVGCALINSHRCCTTFFFLFTISLSPFSPLLFVYNPTILIRNAGNSTAYCLYVRLQSYTELNGAIKTQGLSLFITILNYSLERWNIYYLVWNDLFNTKVHSHSP